MADRDVLITGIGLVSSLGIGVDEHWAALTTPGQKPVLDAARFAPYAVHPLPEIDWSAQIPKRGDQRQMETWQRLGTFAAGLALDDAGMKDDEALCGRLDMIVAAGGGERDRDVDTSILEGAREREDREVLLNEKLTTELRPTLFLAQLSNLLAGNISIVHKVTGSSRTFMGEEGAGVSAVETATARVACGQSDHILIGGAFQTEHPDMLLAMELGGYLDRGPWRPVWQREGPTGGVVAGSGAAFLVLESRAHAQARGRQAYARMDAVVSERARRAGEDLSTAIESLLARLGPSSPSELAISGASGAQEATQAERAAFNRLQQAVPRGMSSMTGHMKEAQFPFAVALCAMALARGETYPPFDPETETALDGAPDQALATCIGYSHFEGAARLARA